MLSDRTKGSQPPDDHSRGQRLVENTIGAARNGLRFDLRSEVCADQCNERSRVSLPRGGNDLQAIRPLEVGKPQIGYHGTVGPRGKQRFRLFTLRCRVNEEVVASEVLSEAEQYGFVVVDEQHPKGRHTSGVDGIAFLSHHVLATQASQLLRQAGAVARS